MAEAKTKEGRVLGTILHQGARYAPNMVVVFAASDAEIFEADGRLDCSKEAVAYCKKELKVKSVTHKETDAHKEAVKEAAAAAKAEEAKAKVEADRKVKRAEKALKDAKAAAKAAGASESESEED